MNVNEITLSNTPKSSNNSQGAFAAKSGGRRWLSCLRTAQDGGRRRAAAEGIASPPDASRILHEVYEEAGKMRRGSGRVPKADEIASIIDRRADRPVPDRLYRGQTGSGITSSFDWTGPDAQDRYLAAIIAHAGSHSGTEQGRAPSLTMSESTAEHFARARPGAKVWIVDTTHGRQDFRTIEDILKNDGPRLVLEGKVSKPVLARAVGLTVTNQWEDEVFYTRGSVPQDWARPRGPRPLPRPLEEARLRGGRDHLAQNTKHP